MTDEMIEYQCHLSSVGIAGDVKIKIGEEGLDVLTLFDQIHLSYAELSRFAIQGVDFCLDVGEDRYVLTKLGRQMESFYNNFSRAYNRKTLRGLFVQATPLYEGRGAYRYEEEHHTASGEGIVQLYDDCVVLLPPDEGARRIPLCFLTGFQREHHGYTLSLDTGATYSFLRLGRGAETFEEDLAQRLHAMRGNAISAVRGICGSLSSVESSAIASLMPEGVAESMGKLRAISPAFTVALEEKIAKSRAAESYLVLKELCEPEKICVGMKSDLAGEKEENVLWLIAPGRKPGVAAVELALSEENAAATYLYRFDEPWEVFRRALNHAMEAVAFRREVISMPEEDLKNPAHSDAAMAVSRTAALRFMRRCFAGRIIHQSAESWEREMKNALL